LLLEIELYINAELKSHTFENLEDQMCN